MDENPYKAPAALQIHATSSRYSFWKLAGTFEWVVCCNLAMLLASASAHRLQAGDVEAYVKGPLIGIVFICSLAALLFLPVTLVRMAVLYATGHRGKGTVCLTLCIATPSAIYATILIDWPLMHIT